MWRGALLILLCLLTMLLGLGRAAIVDSEEGYYAGAGREMVAGGDWTTPHYNFEERLNKPILYYWLVAGTYKALGVTELAARLWAAISGVGLAVVSFLVGRRWASPAAGFLAGAIVATSTGVVMLVRQALPDMPLALFISLTIWGAIEATSTRPVDGTVTGGSLDARSRRRWLALAGVSMGLGMITKGPIAIALPAVALIPFLAWERFSRPAGSSRGPFPVRVSDLLLPTLLFIAVAAPWYVAVTRVHGLDFLKQFFIGENFDRFASDKFNERRAPLFYLWVIAGGLLPWTTFCLLWVGPVRDVLTRRRGLSPTAARLIAWAGGPLLLLSASVGSQPRYILPCIVPIAVLLGRSIWRRIAESPRESRDLLFTSATMLAGATVIAFGALILRAKPLLVGVNPDWSPTGAFVMVAAGVAVLAAAFSVSRRMVPAIVAVAAALTVIAFDLTVLQGARPEPVEVVAAAIRARPPADGVCSCGAFSRNLTFYTHMPVFVGEGDVELRDFIQRQGNVVAVADSVRLAKVEQDLQRRFPRIAEMTYLNPALWQQPGKALLDPDPARWLQHIILVSNH